MNDADITNQGKMPAPPSPPTSSILTPRTVRRWLDHGATGVITIGGWATIFSIFGIFAYLFVEVAPLFFGASWTELIAVRLDSVAESGQDPRNVGVGIDEYREVGYVLREGNPTFYAFPSGTPMRLASVPNIEHEDVTATAHSPGTHHRYGLGTRTGHVLPFSVDFRVTFEREVRRIEPVVTAGVPFDVVPTGAPIVRLAYRETESGTIAAALDESGRLFLTKIQEAAGGGPFALEREVETLRSEITGDGVEAVSVLLLDGLGETLLVGTGDGRLLYWDISTIPRPRVMGVYSVGAPVTALSYLIGDRSVVVGTEQGDVAVWTSLIDPDVGGDPRLKHVRDFTPHAGAVTVISPSRRDKGFLTADATGEVAVHHSTSHQTLIRVPGNGHAVLAATFAPKVDGALVLNDAGRLIHYAIENDYPESTFASLFGPVLYEGYDEPLHVWQSTGGSDAFEPKFGLWPLMFGTLKGTVYAMLLAAPLAVLGAIYTAMFMNPNVRAVVKPVVEIMEALPTVVLGFLAGLWFAPLLETIFPGVVAILITLPLVVAAVCIAWQFLPATMRATSGNVTELAVFFLILCGTVWFCLHFNRQIEVWLFDSDYTQWLHSTFGLAYDQRNALVIAFAMGMAVIPTIFSISEDSLSNIPRHLIAGSLALGATPWQTLTKLVMISASPGLFSALMIGLGRVVGETMIVLMATGNTPVMDVNLFNGFRTLSANIAVEMPEAPHGETLYRLLFLAGLLLFVFTSVVNTIAEVIRQRLRTRYSQF